MQSLAAIQWRSSSPSPYQSCTQLPSFLSSATSTSTCPLRNIRMMGGGPRTFPGGVTKWQWKKMQEKKEKQLLKARLLRERQLYEMRKRAEMEAATAHLQMQKPWEKSAPTLFAVAADQQLQAMADRFVKRGAIDLWTENDGPHTTFNTVEGKPSSRIFPKDAFHSTHPYTRVFNSSIDSNDPRSPRSRLSSSTSPEQAREYTVVRERYASSSSTNKNSNPMSRQIRVQDLPLSSKSGRGSYPQKTADTNTPRRKTKSLKDSLHRDNDRFSRSKVYGTNSNSKPANDSQTNDARNPNNYVEHARRISRVYPEGEDNSRSHSQKTRGDVGKMQTFAGFNLAKGSWQTDTRGSVDNEMEASPNSKQRSSSPKSRKYIA